MAAMVGSIVFFSFVVAPIIFRVLGAESGGRFVRGVISPVLPLECDLRRHRAARVRRRSLVLPRVSRDRRGHPGGGAPGMHLVMLYGGNSLVPQINRARDAGPSAHDRFVRLHRRSVVLNLAVMVAGVGLLIAFACRPAPRTEGIIELSPVERARRRRTRCATACNPARVGRTRGRRATHQGRHALADREPDGVDSCGRGGTERPLRDIGAPPRRAAGDPADDDGRAAEHGSRTRA